MLADPIEQARYNMVAQQIRPWEVIDRRVLSTVKRVPREDFVNADYQGLAFADIEIPIGHGEHMMAPKIEARMLQALNVQSGDRVLEIGTGSGFVTACLAHLGGRVTSIDIYQDFLDTAAERLAQHGFDKVQLEHGDVFDTHFEDGAWDVIAVTGSLPAGAEQMQHLLAQNGRLFVVTGSAPAMHAELITRVDGHAFSREKLFETVLAPLRNAPQPERFVF